MKVHLLFLQYMGVEGYNDQARQGDKRVCEDKMVSKKVQSYIEDHSFCSEYLFKDWEAFLDFLYEEGGRVSSILWWDHCKKNMQQESVGSGGYTDPDDQEWMYAETCLHEDGFEERSLADIKTYIQEEREHGLILGEK